MNTENFNSEELKEEQIQTSSTEVKKEESIDYKEKYLRLYADFENYKKRVQKEKEDLSFQIKANMMSSILDIDNDLHFAKKAMNESESKSIDKEGIDIITNKVSRFLKMQGIEEIQTESYDPDIHEVISVIETGEKKIFDIVSKGYSINGKPLRYPKIILSE
jgi:molecular chaperone GrpE